MPAKTQGRKSDHIQICLGEDVQSRQVTTGFEDIYFVHKALPEIRRSKINLETTIFGHKFSVPLIVEAMTGGITKAVKINAAIASAVEELGLGMGVGSQRAAIEKPRLERTFAIARKKAPTAFLIANIGGPQLVKGYGVKEAKRAVDMMNADALAIHLNALQEVVQPEGETDFNGVLNKIGEIAQALNVPVIVKETGAGIAAEEAKLLASMKVAGIDIAGVGGTSWAAVEYHRAKQKCDEFHQGLGEAFWDWGIPTAVSLIETLQSVSITVIASGGVRTGIDVAKSLSLGANLAGMAHPILLAATRGPREVEKTLRVVIEGLRNAMFLVGAESISKLREVPLVITGKTAEWLKTRGFQPEIYAKRSLRRKEMI
ncbi:MAG: type 2 isopentenyl-diphosphate Delta-isomerase [Candidatus Bathyarchaeia archaeon]